MIFFRTHCTHKHNLLKMNQVSTQMKKCKIFLQLFWFWSSAVWHNDWRTSQMWQIEYVLWARILLIIDLYNNLDLETELLSFEYSSGKGGSIVCPGIFAFCSIDFGFGSPKIILLVKWTWPRLAVELRTEDWQLRLNIYKNLNIIKTPNLTLRLICICWVLGTFNH